MDKKKDSYEKPILNAHGNIWEITKGASGREHDDGNGFESRD